MYTNEDEKQKEKEKEKICKNIFTDRRIAKISKLSTGPPHNPRIDAIRLKKERERDQQAASQKQEFSF